MQESLLDGNLSNTITVVTMGIAGGLLLLRKVLRQLSSDRVETYKESTEVDIIKSLRVEVARLRRDQDADRENNHKALDELKEAHAKEREELVDKISRLEEKLSKFTIHHRDIKGEALEAYVIAVALKDENDLDKIKEKLLAIINSEFVE